MANKKRNLIRRKLRFYRADCGREPDQTMSPLKPIELLRRLKAAIDKSGRYVDIGEEKVLEVFVDNVDVRGRPRLRLARVRRSDHPKLDDPKKPDHESLGLADGSGLAETVHVVFFDENVVGCDYNHYGPRPSALTTFIEEKLEEVVRFNRLIHPNAVTKMANLKNVKSMVVGVRLPDSRPRNDGLFGEFARNSNMGNVARMNIEIVAEPGNHLVNWMSFVKLVQNGPQQLSVFKINGEDDGHPTELNVLNDALQYSADVYRDGDTADVDRSSAYSALDKAYHRNLEVIRASAELLDSDSVVR